MLPTEWELVARVALAAACGAVVGFEREISEKPAGLRTHALVALGAAAFTVAGYASLSLPNSENLIRVDVARIAAQVVSGIGFLGAGIIIFHGDRLRGLTTAAELWAVAAIGVLAGLGYLIIAAMTTLLILLVVSLKPVERHVDRIRMGRVRRWRRTHPGEAEEELENGDSEENGEL